MKLVLRVGATALLLAVGHRALATVTVTPIEDKPAAPSAPAAGAGAAGGAASQPGDGELSVEGVKKLMGEGEYREALRLIGKAVEMRGADRVPLLMMRGECQLQIHENASAVSTLQQAAREALAGNNTVASGDAAAFATLIQKSPRDVYVPVNSPEKKPVDILDKGKRNGAYEALFTDMQVVLQAKVRIATTNGSLPPFVEAARDIPAMRGVEHVSSGSTKLTDKFAKETAAAAGKIISTTLTDFDTRVTDIATAAEHVVYTNQAYGNTRQIQHTGLSPDSVQTLENIETDCGKIPGAVKELTQAFGTADPFVHLATRAQSIGKRAREVRTKDYAVP